MGPKHSREEFLAAAVNLALAEGLSALSFARVAASLGTNDRTVVYYFPTKGDLVGAVLQAVGARLQETLATAMTEPARDHAEVVRQLWPLLDDPGAERVFALFFEAIGLAATGRPPYTSVVPALMEAWVSWTADQMVGPPARRRAEAEAAVALVDGLLILRQNCGAAAADRAAKRLGI